MCICFCKPELKWFFTFTFPQIQFSISCCVTILVTVRMKLRGFPSLTTWRNDVTHMYHQQIIHLNFTFFHRTELYFVQNVSPFFVNDMCLSFLHSQQSNVKIFCLEEINQNIRLSVCLWSYHSSGGGHCCSHHRWSLSLWTEGTIQVIRLWKSLE